MKPPKIHQFLPKMDHLGFDGIFLKTQPNFWFFEPLIHLQVWTVVLPHLSGGWPSNLPKSTWENGLVWKEENRIIFQIPKWLKGNQHPELERDLLKISSISSLFARSCCWYAGCAPQRWWHAKGWSWPISPLGQPQKLCCFLVFFWDWSTQIPSTQVVGSWGNDERKYSSDFSTLPLGFSSIWGVVWPHHLAAHCTEFHRHWSKHGGHVHDVRHLWKRHSLQWKMYTKKAI